MPSVRSTRSLNVVSHVLLLVACVFSPAAADKSVATFLGSQDVPRSGRALQNAAVETDAPIVEQLTSACNLPDGIEQFLSGDSSGEVCQLAASVVGRGNRRTYEFELTQHHEHDLSFQVVLQPLEGKATVYVSPPYVLLCLSAVSTERCVSCSVQASTKTSFVFRSFEHYANNEWSTQASTEEWSSGNSFIYVVEELKYGKNRVVLESMDIVSTFSLRIEFFRGGRVISAASALVLKYFKDRCCDGEGGPCTGLLPLVGTDREAEICDSAGNHCDNDSELTHLDLSESNMHCDLAEIDFLAAGLDNLQVCCLRSLCCPAALQPRLVNSACTAFSEHCGSVQVLMLNANNIKGDLSDANVLKNLAALERLEILELGNLPGAPCHSCPFHSNAQLYERAVCVSLPGRCSAAPMRLLFM